MSNWTMRSWISAHAVALVVIVLAAPALVGVTLGLQLYQNAQRQATPIEADKSKPIELAGYTWTLVASEEFPHSVDNEVVPEGLALTAAIIQARPGDDPQKEGSCSAILTSGTGPEARRWSALGNPYEFNYEVLDESTTTCLLEGEPFDLEVIYLTPEGTISESVIELTIGVLGGELVRFALTD